MKFLLLILILGVSQTIQYNEVESIALAAHSLSSYCRQEHLNPYDCGKICERSELLEDVQFMNDYESNLFGYFGYKPSTKQVIVVYRGTILSDKRNLLLDFDIFFTDYEYCSYCKVARGYYNAYQKLQSQSRQLYQSYSVKYPDVEFVATGHSLGAVLATLFVADIQETFGQKIDYMYTFGSPRIGNKEFTEYFNSLLDPVNNMRVVKARDMVARIPSSDLGYFHVGNEIYYDEEDNYIFCESEIDPSCNQYYFWQLNFQDHQKYVKCTFAEFRGDPKCTSKQTQNN